MRHQQLLDLIRAGKLSTGINLHHVGRRRRDFRDVQAEVVSQGLKVRGRVYSTPSAAAVSVTGKPVDGWLFWKLPDGRNLGSLRT
jgi:RAMA domain-containing protein